MPLTRSNEQSRFPARIWHYEDALVLAMAYARTENEKRGRRLFDEHVKAYESNKNNVWYAAHYKVLRAEAHELFYGQPTE